MLNHPFRLTAVLLAAGLLAACMPRTSGLISPEECPLVPGERRVASYVDGQGKTGISGRVVLKGEEKPLDGAYVNIYPDTISNLLGPSQFISSPTDQDGRYRLEVPPGTYYVVARKRMSGQATGPLAPGDFYSEHQRIVTAVIAGKMAVVDLEVVPMKAPMFFKKEVVERETDTGVRGVLVDGSGKPVAGGFAMAYSDPQMKRLPDYASTLSDAEGRFTLYLPGGGTFFLAGRIHAWDMPQPGEPYGILGGATPQPMQVPKGTFVEGVRIVLEPFAGEHKEGKSRRPF
jgi:hypothetical protein